MRERQPRLPVTPPGQRVCQTFPRDRRLAWPPVPAHLGTHLHGQTRNFSRRVFLQESNVGAGMAKESADVAAQQLTACP